MKKIISLLSAFALVALMVPQASAATPVAVANASDITLTSTGTVTADVVNLIVKQGGITVLSAGNYTVDSATNGTIVIGVVDGGSMDSDGVVNTPNLKAANYQVSYVTAGGVMGIAYVPNANTNTVTVSAVVYPTLSMTVSAATIAFGELVPGAVNSKSVNVTTATNAKTGAVVTVASTGLATGPAVTDYHIGGLQRTASVATAAADLYQIVSSTNNGGTILAKTDVIGTQTVLTADNTTKANAITAVTLEATAQAQTEAGNYNDTLTFTVTGNF